MPRSLQDLYKSRCVTNNDGRLVPHFWQPMPMQKRQLCLFGDESRRMAPHDEAMALRSMQRLILLGLALELDVGKFIQEQSKREIPSGPHVKELLMSAVADEARHEKGFRYAAEVYGVPTEQADLDMAEQLKAAWNDMANKYQPLAIAGVLEQQVFLVTLGLMRLIGGPALSELAIRIAQDESRHVATNVAITKWLKVSFANDITDLAAQTLAYAAEGLAVQLTSSTQLNLDFCINASAELKQYNRAQQLDSLTRIAAMPSPFEIKNRHLYASRETEAGQTVY